MSYLDTEPGALGGPCPTTGCSGVAVGWAEEERVTLGARCPYRCRDCVAEMDAGRLPDDIGDAPDLLHVLAFGLLCAAFFAVILFAVAAITGF